MGSESKTYQIYQEGYCEPKEIVTKWGLADALADAALEFFHESAGEIGEEFDLFCEGKLYNVTVEHDPYFNVGDGMPEDPGEMEEHECSPPEGEGFCYECFSHTRKVREFNQRQRMLNDFKELQKEYEDAD